MIRRALLGCAAAALLTAAAEPAANPIDFGRAGPMIERADALLAKGKAKEAIAQLLKAEKAAPTAEIQAIVATTRGLALRDMGDRAAAMTAFGEAERASPGNPAVRMMLFGIGMQSRDLDLANESLNALIDNYPDIAREMDVDQVRYLGNGFYLAGRGSDWTKTRVRLGRIGFGGDWIDTRDAYAVDAIDDDLKRGDIDGARSIAATLEDTDTLTIVLTNRRYEALWPSVEARIGDGMEQPVNAAVIVTERLWRDNPNDVRARHARMNALNAAGRKAEAEKLGADFAGTPEALAEVNEPGGWLINTHASILRSLDRKAEADTRLAALLATPIEQKPWLINMMINRAFRPVYDGDAAAAAPLLAGVEPMAAKYGSPYARQLIREYKVCHAVAAHMPGDEVAARVTDLLGHEKDAAGATVSALLCAGRGDEAAARTIAMLDDPDQRDNAIGFLQAGADAGHKPDWAGDPASLYQRADVRAAFDKVGRVLPKRFEIKD